MNKGIMILVCAALLGSAMLSGCNKILEGSSDKTVRFSAINQGNPATKTEYGDDVKDENTTWQIIDWKAGDVIRISSDLAKHRYEDRKWSDYSIESSTINGHQSIATIENVESGTLPNGQPMKNGLVWGEDAAQKYTFWGIYPSTTQNADITLGNAGAVSAELPTSITLGSSSTTSTKYVKADGTVTTTQSEAAYTYTVYEPDMDYAYMTAVASEVSNDTKFDLVFKPAFTAFEINLTSLDESFSITGVSLSSDPDATTKDYLSGKFTMTAGDLTTVTAGTGASQTVSATVSANLTPSSGVTVTLFTIPKTNANMLSLTVQTNEGNATLKFTKKGSTDPYPFEAGKKYRINLLKVGNRWKDMNLTFAVQHWDVVDVSAIDTKNGSINMSNVTWQNTKVKRTENGAVENTLDNGHYSVYMFNSPFVDPEGDGTWVKYSGYYPAQAFFTVNYPLKGLFKIGMIPAYGQTEADLDASKFEIQIYDPVSKSFRAMNPDGEDLAAWREYAGSTLKAVSTIYFRVCATADSGLSSEKNKAQVDIWFKPADATGLTANSEWISAYSELRANYACVLTD